MITNAIADMIIQDVIPAHIVEKHGFRNLILLLDPRYTMVSRQHMQYTLLPEKARSLRESIKQELTTIPSCAVTLDIWSSRRMHSYFGLTCHFVTDEWEMKSFLLRCKHMVGRHTGENVALEYDSTVEEYGITEKVFKAVTDNASNMCKAFKVSIEELVQDDDDSDVEHELSSEGDSTCNYSNDDEDDTDISDGIELLDASSHYDRRISCFAHTLQLTVKDGLEASRQVKTILAKVSKIVNHIKKSTVATEKLELKNRLGIVNKNNTRWNSQLKMVRRLLELDIEDVIDKNELKLSVHDKAILKSFVLIFEHFEIATDLLQGEHYASISMAIPSYLGILQHLNRMKTIGRYNLLVVDSLLESLERRLGGILDEPVYCISTVLDPSFKLRWCSEDRKDDVKKMVKDEMIKYSNELLIQTLDQPTEPSQNICQPPSKKKKLFGFMDDMETEESRSTRESGEFEDYLNDTNFEKNENPLKFWKANASKYPLLAKIARVYLGVPATSAPIERVFSHGGNIMRPDRSRLLPKNFEHLIFLKVNNEA